MHLSSWMLKEDTPLASVECNTDEIHSIEPILKTGKVLLKRKQLYMAGLDSYCPEMPVCKI